MKIFIFTISFFLFCLTSFSQEENLEIQEFNTDSIQKKSFFKKGHDPRKAAILSAVLPGAGQYYNKKYWKIPVVYAGLGGLGAWVAYNAKQLNNINTAYRTYFDGDSTTNGFYKNYTTQSQLSLKRSEYKKSLDVAAISLGIWYLLNIVDATVDAHLIDFDVNQDISISLVPDIKMKTAYSLDLKNNFYTGVSMKVNFK